MTTQPNPQHEQIRDLIEAFAKLDSHQQATLLNRSQIEVLTYAAELIAQRQQLYLQISNLDKEIEQLKFARRSKPKRKKR